MICKKECHKNSIVYLGVALAIANAAGHELEKECRKFISKNQFLGIAEVFVSSPGKLSCKKVNI